MNQICEIRKRPSFWAIAGAMFLVVIFGSVLIFAMSFAKTPLWLNGLVIWTLVVTFLLAPLILWQAELSITIEPAHKGFLAIRRLFVFKACVGKRCFDELDDVFWKKHEHVEDDGVKYHVYGRYSVNDDLETARDVLISGGFWHLVSPNQNEVDQLRSCVRELRDKS